MKKTVIVGVGSGIAAYKALDLVGVLKKQEIEVRVIMTHHATQMISITEFEKASENKVYTELFEKGFDYRTVLKNRKVEHIELADSADLMVIVPATANIIGQLAHGMASDYLTTTALAMTKPVLVCPSMNVNMWHNPQVQENVMLLKKNGYQIVEPTEGMLACGYEGKGRLEEVELIAKEVLLRLENSKSLTGKKIIVTAGGTSEKIDEVRFISNKSSGKMGAAIAEECYLRGAEVLLLRAKDSVEPRFLILEKTFETSEDLFSLIKNNIKEANFIFHTAAVSDFLPEETIKGKISSKKKFSLKLIPNIKIINQIKKLNPKIKLIAFKTEFGLSDAEMIKAAKKKLKESGADGIVVNEIGKEDRGFAADTNEVIVVLKNGESAKMPLNSKREIAKGITEIAASRL